MVLAADEAHALAARARLVARAVVGLVFDEQRAARFVHAYCSDYRRPGLAGEAERKTEFLGAIERESLLLVAARIERTLPQVVGPRFSGLGQSEAAARFREAYLAFLGGSLAWDGDERESFRKDLAMYLRLASRNAGAPAPRPSHPVTASPDPAPAGAFVDRCAFLVDPSMLVQAREAAARYQAELESCADEAVRAAFRGLRAGARHARAGKSPPRRRPARGSRSRAPARQPRSRQRPATGRQKSRSPRARRRSRRRPRR